MNRFWSFVIGMVVGVGAVAAVVFGYFEFGFAPAAATAPPMPFEKMLARAALHAQRGAGTHVPAPIEPTEANLLAGARVYRSSCVLCHGLPGSDKAELKDGMYPSPPLLLTGKGVTDDPPGETHWVVQNGIRMTGMPAFGNSFTQEQLWQVTLLLSRAHELPASVNQLLAAPDCVRLPAADPTKDVRGAARP